MVAEAHETEDGAAPGATGASTGGTAAVQRIDKWLFFARVVKSRTLAQKLVASGGVRVNRDKIANPAQKVRVGDTLTVSYADAVRVLKIRAPGERRGPASEAALLYEDLSEPTVRRPSAEPAISLRPDAPEKGTGRPSKKDRRSLSRLKGGDPG